MSAPISCFANYGQCEGCAIKAEPNQRDYGAPKRLQLGRGYHRDRPGLGLAWLTLSVAFAIAVACMCNTAKVSLSQCRSIFTAIKALRKYLPWNRIKITGEFFIFIFCEYTQKILLTQIPRTRKRNRTVRTITSRAEYPIQAYSMKRYPALHTFGVFLLSTKKVRRVGELSVSTLMNRLLFLFC